MRIIDLSHLIMENMPAYPGTTGPSIVNNSSVHADGYAEKQINLQTHTGTHVDSPAHMISAGNTLDDLPLDKFMGVAQLLNCTGVKVLDQQFLESQQDRISRCEFVILQTGWSAYWGQEKYFRDFPLLTTGAAQWLSGFDLKGIGVDCSSVDDIGSETFPVHKILLSKNILIIENLTDLDRVKTEEFTFCCFPLKIQQADGSPVRAVAIVDKRVMGKG
jgi:kynurenine formamidase